MYPLRRNQSSIDVRRAIQRHPEPGLKQSVADWQSVIEDRIIGEVSHRKVVDPVQRARMPYPVGVYALHR